MIMDTIFPDERSSRIAAGARRTIHGWEWWLVTTRFDRDLGCHVEDFIDGGEAATRIHAAHSMQQALGAMFG